MNTGRDATAGRPGRLATVRPDALAAAYARLVQLAGRACAPLARPAVAGLVALLVYLWRGSLGPHGLGHTNYNYFSYLADAFLHGQLSLRLTPPQTLDLAQYSGKLYLYWLPFPAIVLTPFVAVFGVGVSDVLYTLAFGAITVALIARLLAVLDRTGVAPLSVERRATLVSACAFGSVLLILAPVGSVWFTSQLVGVDCVLLGTIIALERRGRLGYLLLGVTLACAMATRLSLVFNGVWLAYYLYQRDCQSCRLPARRWLGSIVWAAAPVAVTLLLLGWYNLARFGSPLDMGIAYHRYAPEFRANFVRYGIFSLHYLPTNLFYQFVAYPLFMRQPWEGGGLFWMTPVFTGAVYAVWRGRGSTVVRSLALTCVVVYVPIGLLGGTGYLTYGPRYLLDLIVPLVTLTALGIRRWRPDVLVLLLLVSWATYAVGSLLWLASVRY